MDHSTPMAAGHVPRPAIQPATRGHAPARPSLAVHWQPGASEHHAALAGELDVATSTHLLGEEAQKLGATADAHDLVLDLQQLSFCDSVGIGTLVQLNNAAADRGTALRLRRPSDNLAQLIELTGLADLFIVEQP